MLHIILFILKILGCILLAILGLLLILLLIVLFVPIKYNMDGSYYDSPDISAKITWLFGAIKAKAEFRNQEFRVRVTLLWKTLFDTKKDEDIPVDFVEEINDSDIFDDGDNLKADNQKTPPISDAGIETGPTEISRGQSISGSNVTKEEQSTPVQNSPPKGEKKKKLEKKKKPSSDEDKADTAKVSFFEKCSNVIENIIDKIENTFDNIENKLDSLTCKIDKIDRFIHAQCTQNSIALIKKMLISLLKHIAPNKFKGKIHFGFDKPSMTGKILGYASAFYPLYGESIQLEPDFEETIIEGDLSIKGSIQLYIFVFWALRAILCKDIRKLIKYIKHLKS